MKKIFSLVLFIFLISNMLFSQDLITKIPKDAALVGVLKGHKILEQVSLKELKKFHFAKDLFNDGKDSIEHFDLTGNAYFFISLTDSIAYNCVLLPLKSKTGFEQMMKKSETEKYGDFKGVMGYDEFILWDEQAVLLVYPFGMKKPNRYGCNEEDEFDVVAAMEAEDKEKAMHAAAAVKEAQKTRDAVEEIDVVVFEETESIEEDGAVNVEIVMDEESAFEQRQRLTQQHREHAYERRIEAFQAKQHTLLERFAVGILSSNSKVNSIASNPKYLKSFNKKAAASIWSDSYNRIYTKFLGFDNRAIIGSSMSNYMGMASRLSSPEATGIKEMVAHVFLTKEEAEMKIKTVMTDEMAGYYKAIGKRKFNKNFFKYFDGDKVLGYFGFAMNVENSIEVYPNLMTSILKNIIPEYAEEAALSAELASIVLDAEEIGELIKGDALFVISDVIDKEIKYKSYEYDDEFNSKEVEKTRIEPMPEFLFMASTERMDFFKKLLKIGVKYKTVLAEPGNIFKLDLRRNPMEVYFVLQDDIFFMASSEYQARDIAAGKKGPTSRKHKKMARNQSSIFYANNDRILSAIPKGSFPRDAMSVLDLFQVNFESADFKTSRIKRNTITSSISINTTGKSENALKAFYELGDKFYQID